MKENLIWCSILALVIFIVSMVVYYDSKTQTQPAISHATMCERAGGVPVSASLYAEHRHMICVRQDALIPIR